MLNLICNENLHYFLCSCRNPIFRKSFVPEIWTKVFSANQKQSMGVFYKTAIPKSFVILKGRHLCWGFFFIKVEGLYVSNRITKGLQYRYFLVNIGKFIRTSILKNQKLPPEVFCRKSCSSKFCKIRRKHLCQGLVLNKVTNICQQLY